MRARYGIAVAGLVAGVLYWPLEAAIHTFVFGRGSFASKLFPSDPNEIWMRLIISFSFMAFGFYAQRAMHQQRQLLERLRSHEERLRSIIDSAYDAYVSIDHESRITGWNLSAEKLFGWERREVMGRSLAEVVIPERFRPAHLHGMRRYLETGIGARLYRQTEVTARYRDGREFQVQMAIIPLRADGGQEFYTFIRALGEPLEKSRERWQPHGFADG